MIRRTLAATQAATFAISLPHAGLSDMPAPRGTGFFASEDGLFVTARHVVEQPSGVLRTDIPDAWIESEGRHGAFHRLCLLPDLIFEDAATDLAVLRVDFTKNADRDWLQGRSGFPHLRISRRPLEEGEPVYAYGYPLSDARLGRSSGGLSIGLKTLYPRVTSAIVAADREAYGAIQGSGDPVSYVLDKALNYGNSGGPIVATETGCVHAVCTRFQPVAIPQAHLRDSSGKALTDEHGGPAFIITPSLYGVVSSLENPAALDFLEDQGAATVDE